MVFALLRTCGLLAISVISLNEFTRASHSGIAGAEPLFADVASRFAVQREQVVKGGERDSGSTYNDLEIEKVNQLLQQTQENILARVPVDDRPLRLAIEKGVPTKISSSEPAVPAGVVKQQLDAAFEFLKNLTKLTELRVDLRVESYPEEAEFELISPDGTRIPCVTNHILKNVYRGVYKYAVNKIGYKVAGVSPPIDLISDPGVTITCKLVVIADENHNTYCQLR
jgi:hypothetical protein